MRILSSLIFFVWCLQLQSQQVSTSDTLEYLVIESPMVQKSVIKLPSSYSQINSGHFISNTGNSVVGTLSLITGASAQIGALNTNRITIRGVGSRNPYGTNRVKAYFSGIPISGGDGTTELEDISQNLVSSVEILKGGKSAFYGAGLGGVIILNPIDFAQRGFHGELSAQRGSDGLSSNQIMLSYGSEKSSTIFNFGHYHVGGWRDNSDFTRYNYFLFHEQKIKSHHLKFIALSRNLKAEIPSSLNYDHYRNDPSSAAFTWQMVNGRESNQKNLVAIEDEVSFGTSFRNQLTVFYDWYEGNEYRPFNDYLDNNHRIGLRSRLAYEKQKLAIGFMLEAYREFYEWQTFEVDSDQLINHLDERRVPIVIGLDAGYSISSNWFLESGLSLNFLRYRVFNHTTEIEDFFDYPAKISPFVGMSYTFDKGSTIYGNFSHGFSYPSVEETLYPEGVKNPNLLPETGITYEIGWKYQSNDRHFLLDWAAYHLTLNDLLLTERIENGDSYGVNGGAATNMGTEILLEKRFLYDSKSWIHHLSISNALTLGVYRFNDFVNEGEDFSGNDLPGIPNRVNILVLKGKAGKSWSYSANYHIVGNQYLNDENTENLDSYSVLNADLNFHKEIGRVTVSMGVGLKNILNQQYSGMVVVNAPAFGNNDPRYYYPAQPRNYAFDLKLSF